MRVVRYILFVHFLFVLGLLAVVYAAPDLIFLQARAAGDAATGCSAAECSPSSAAEAHLAVAAQPLPQESSDLPVDSSAAPGSGLLLEGSESADVPAAAPGIATGLWKDDLEALRPQPLGGPAGAGSGPSEAWVDEATRVDRALSREAATQGLDLQEILRVEADLMAFVQEVSTGHAGVVRGVFVADTLTMPVRRQPSGSPGFISLEEGAATQFGMAEGYGSIGLLAHNHLAGSLFFDLEAGQAVYLVYGDGDVRRYVVSEIHRYQAGQPNSPYSDFYDLDNGGERYSAKDLFHMMYNRDGDVVFQTCIEGDGISTWGRLFVIARPA